MSRITRFVCFILRMKRSVDSWPFYLKHLNRVNTGSPVVFTINPPQCQMEVRRGFGTAGTRTSGPVTVGDPLTLLIHMKSEKGKFVASRLLYNNSFPHVLFYMYLLLAGFDILVKNCIAHNGAQQRLQLIDPNGYVYGSFALHFLSVYVFSEIVVVNHLRRPSKFAIHAIEVYWEIGYFLVNVGQLLLFS